MGSASRFLLVLLALGASVHDARVSTSGISGSVRVRRSSANWNGVADVLLRHASSEITSQGKSRVPLPDIRENFSKKKGFIKLRGEFVATGGWLENFSTLGRVGDVTVVRDGYASVMTAVLGLSDLRIGYDQYDVDIWGHGIDGNFQGKIGKNAIRFVIKFNMGDEGCLTTLQEVKVVEFDDFSVRVSGLGSFDWLAEKVVEWVTGKRRDDIKASVEKKLRQEIEKALEDFECEEYAGLMIPI